MPIYPPVIFSRPTGSFFSRALFCLFCLGILSQPRLPAQIQLRPAAAAESAPRRIAQGYCYIANFQSRFECLMDLRTALEWLAMSSLEADLLSAEAVDEVTTKAAALASTWCVAQSGRTALQTRLALTQILLGVPGRTQPITPGVNIPIQGAMLAFMWEIPHDSTPQDLQILWKGFIDNISALPVTVQFGGVSETHTLTPVNAVLRWANDNRLPPPAPLAPVPELAKPATLPLRLGALVWFTGGLLFVIAMYKRRRRRTRRLPASAVVLWLAGTAAAYPFVVIQLPVSSGEPNKITQPQQAQEILSPLLRNIYRAFDHRQEGTIYDLLARSADGPLLKTLYLDIISALSLDESEAARVHVSEFSAEVLEVDPPAGDGSLTAKTSWTTLGSIGHWGHTHTRTTVNLARITASPAGGSWKITAVEMLDQRRL